MFTVSYTGTGEQNEGSSSESARSPGKFFKIVECLARILLHYQISDMKTCYRSCHLLNHVLSEPWLDKETISNFSNCFPINLIALLWQRISSNTEEKFTQLSPLPILNHSRLSLGLSSSLTSSLPRIQNKIVPPRDWPQNKSWYQKHMKPGLGGWAGR